MTFRVSKDFGRRRYLPLLSALLCWFLGSDISISRLALVDHHYYETHWGGGLKGNERRTAVKSVKLDLLSVWSLSVSEKGFTLSFFISLFLSILEAALKLHSSCQSYVLLLLVKTHSWGSFNRKLLQNDKFKKKKKNRENQDAQKNISRCKDAHHNFTTTLFHQNINLHPTIPYSMIGYMIYNITWIYSLYTLIKTPIVTHKG